MLSTRQTGHHRNEREIHILLVHDVGYPEDALSLLSLDIVEVEV